MSYYSKAISPTATPQSEPLPFRKDMILNNAGGYNFKVDPFDRLVHFLILGTEGTAVSLGGSSRPLTIDNAKNIFELIALDGVRVVQTLVDMVEAVPSRLPKMDPAIFVLGLCVAAGDPHVKEQALLALPSILRIPTHLFKFLSVCKELGVKTGGRQFKRALISWYHSRDNDQLAYHLAKYQSRDGWSHRDVFRVSHIIPRDPVQQNLIRWAVTGDVPTGQSSAESYLCHANELLRGQITMSRVIELIQKYRFTHEMVPTKWHGEPAVWEALLGHMPMTAMIRNLGKMTSIGLLRDLSDSANLVTEKMTQENILRARIHPMNILVAHRQYRAGRGLRGSLSWSPNVKVLRSLGEGFYSAFGTIEPTGKRHMVALDVSSSMGWSNVMGIPDFTPYEAEAALCMIPLRTESQTVVVGFETAVRPIPLAGDETLPDALRIIRSRANNMGGTDCSAAILYASRNKIPVDVFMMYTDNETWAGRVHPSVALDDYRQKTGIDAKLVVNSMTATNHSIADPKDPNMLNIVGFDSSQPQLVSQFLRV